jgi:SAM-dependent methyltransferase
MGRCNISVEDEHRWVFNRIAPWYRFRPEYPPALVAWLAALAGPCGRAVDLGAGTGLLAVPLARRGLDVTAVEPAALMLQELRGACDAKGVRVSLVHASAESTGLAAGGFDLALVADAHHWLDPQLAGPEVHRLLRPKAACVVVEIELQPTPFLAALQARLRAANQRRPASSAGRREQLLSLAVPRAPYGGAVRLSQTTRLGEDQLRGLLCSLSYVGPALGPAALEQVLQDAVGLANEHGGATWSRDLVVTWRGSKPLPGPGPLTD